MQHTYNMDDYFFQDRTAGAMNTTISFVGVSVQASFNLVKDYFFFHSFFLFLLTSSLPFSTIEIMSILSLRHRLEISVYSYSSYFKLFMS